MEPMIIGIFVANIGGYGFWIGGHDISGDNNWIWFNSLKPVGDFIWRSGKVKTNRMFEIIL